MHLGNNSIFINLARMLWAFDIRKARDAKGNEIPVDINAYTNGFNSLPLPFDISITARSPAHAKVIEREFEEASEEFKIYETL